MTSLAAGKVPQMKWSQGIGSLTKGRRIDTIYDIR
jgi:hypothetical protein